jgi:hypothetical protein
MAGEWRMGTGWRGFGSGRWRRAAILLVCLNVMVAASIAAWLGGGIARGVVLAAGDPDPVASLGTLLDTDGCHSAPLSIGEGLFVACPDFSAVTTPAGIAQVISLYDEGSTVMARFGRPLPQGLAWHSTIAEVKEALGRPRLITDLYGAPTMVYMYDTGPYGSLELVFDTGDRLVRLNACLTR